MTKWLSQSFLSLIFKEVLAKVKGMANLLTTELLVIFLQKKNNETKQTGKHSKISTQC